MAKKDDRGLRFMQLAGKKELTVPRVADSPMPRGSRFLQEIQRKANVVPCFGEYEEKYQGGTTSYTEFMIICALRHIFKTYENGGEGTMWTYQESYMGGRHIPGGAVVDFVIYGELYNVGLRIQTYYWHFAQGSDKQETDFDQKISLENGGLRIIDIYEQDFINDPTGKDAIRITMLAIQELEAFNPRAGGIVVGAV